MNKKILYPVLALSYFVTLYILFNASINQLIYPFAFACAFALIWCGQKFYIVLPAFLGAGLLFDFSIPNLVYLIITCMLMVFPFLFNLATKKKTKMWGMILLVGASQLSKLIYIYNDVEEIIYMVITIIVGILFFLTCEKVIRCVIKKSWVYKLTNIELISAGIIVVAFSCGISSFSIGQFEFIKFFTAISLLIVCFLSKRSICVILSCLIAFGSILPSGNTLFVAPIMIWALAIIIFKSNKGYLSAGALILAEAGIGYLLNIYYSFGIIQFLPVILASLIFVLIPKQYFDKAKVVFDSQQARLALKNLYNQGRDLVGRRLENLSNVFFEMNLVFKAMLKNSMSEDDIKNLLFKEVKKRVCENCPEKSRCHRTFCEDTTKSFEELISKSFSKGKVTLLDIPSFLNSRCGKVNLIISNINALCSQYKKYSEIMGTLDTSKLLIAEQFYGISNIIKGLSKEVSVNVSFDNVREEKIKNELIFNNIICSDSVVYDKDIHTKEVSLIVRNEDESKKQIKDIVSEICEAKMIVSSRNAAVTPGWTNLILKNAPKYDCVFGLSLQTKNGSDKSGDSHSEIRLSENKFLFALCDGMGSGQKAMETSHIAISLIENFYKAGFDNETILSSVNKLLLLQRDENFSAIDVAVVDLSSGIIDIIKMGSPSGYLLNEKEVQVIEGGTLPIGIVGESKPKIKKYIVGEDEYLVLMSDGISDSFVSDRQLADYISRNKTQNPQSLADDIMQKALENNGGIAKDDMSVLVIKIFQC